MDLLDGTDNCFGHVAVELGKLSQVQLSAT